MRTKLYISDKLKQKLLLFADKSEIARILINGEIEPDKLHEDYVNFLSIDEKAPNRISYISKDRLVGMTPSEVWTSTKRYDARFGAVINRIFKSLPNTEVENFSVLMKAAFTQMPYTFSVTEGEGIKKWYYGENYKSIDKGTLGASCMKHSHSQSLLSFYIDNKDIVKLLIMTDKDNLLVGRALIWNPSSDIKVMDRIYTYNTDDEFYFKQWADENGYSYKQKQNWNSPFLLESKGQKSETKLSFKVKYYPGMGTEWKKMPYLDTFKWFDVNNGTLFNYKPDNLDNIRTFILTDGNSYGPNHLDIDMLDSHYWVYDEIITCKYNKIKTNVKNTVWSDICEDYILSKDSQYSEAIGSYIFNKKFEFLNPLDKINKILNQRKLDLEKSKQRIKELMNSNLTNVSDLLNRLYSSNGSSDAVRELLDVVSEGWDGDAIYDDTDYTFTADTFEQDLSEEVAPMDEPNGPTDEEIAQADRLENVISRYTNPASTLTVNGTVNFTAMDGRAWASTSNAPSEG